ncbi:phosphate ABC transporter substrate-binding protein [Acinetobacter sp. RIT592]|uniref:phosphate ABC transporter substrate-binding protein n=1 Tax=Paraclostridium bifermentans TaxID=1490 RepID=UPI000DF82650|nr:phosphate ABC transporter substrate-binding protein [Paraclostridium bifermentans]MDU3801486.1 phosphate ABC transporter substrate-binding protein [Paraclostridium bifermentans]RDC50543.1 phosphate ABC transporter substrate-binding protein [Acinetobacter sp. RIT592]
MFKKKIGVLLMSTIMVGTLAVGCGSKNSGGGSKVSVSGSTSVGPLMEKEAEAYKSVDSKVSIEINQLGSSAGIKDAINGVAEIGMSSRDLKGEEKQAGLKEDKIAVDGIGIITHKNNKVKSITMDQLKGIYTGKITNWKELGGKDAPIVVVSREDGSGTRDAFQEIVGFESTHLTKEAQISDGNGNIKSTVAGNENAIGYTSFSYLDDSIHTLQLDGVDATAANAKDGKYKLSRPFLLVYKEDKLSENGKKFMDYITSEDGQKVVEEEGLITLK